MSFCALISSALSNDFLSITLVYDGRWRCGCKILQDSVVKKAPEEEFVNLVKQTYRVLLTRGMKGCYVYFEDAATREFFLSRMKAERASAVIEA